MRKFYFRLLVAVVMLSIGTGVHARRITPSEAKSTAQSFVAGKSTTRSAMGSADLVLAETVVADASAEPCYYVFNAANKAGFIIVTADTELPAVLAYSNEGSYDPSNASPAFKDWMEGYKQQIEDWYAQGSPAIASNAIKTRGGEHNPIEPLIQTKWNQSNPYNLLSPKDNGKDSYTGCVATSMSQVLYYHKWPQSPVTTAGSHTSERQYPNQTFDYSTATYDWDDMTLTYSTSSSSAAKNAVSKLMFAAGVSVDMHWSSTGSGAFSCQVPYAFSHYFGYTPAVFFWERTYYSDDEWDALIYGELEAKRPVIYSGSSNTGGHSFICDGYDNGGYYHINWGWGGSQDGYYYLNYLNPQNNGYPGQTNQDGDGYNKNQGAVCNIRPPYEGQDDDIPFPVLLYNGSLSFKEVDSSNAFKDKFEFIDLENYEYNPSAYVRLYHPPVYDAAGKKVANNLYLYLPLFKEDGTFVYTPGGTYTEMLNGGYYFTSTVTATNTPGMTYQIMRTPVANFVDLDRMKTTIIEKEGCGPGRYKMELWSVYNNYIDTKLHKVRPSNGFTSYVYVDIDKDGGREYTLPDMTGVFVEEVQITPDEISIKPNESVQLKAVCLPTTAQNKNITWRSENPAIAKVSQDGVVTGVKTGDCNILAYASDRMDADVAGICIVTVDPNAGVKTVESSSVVVKGANGVITVSGVANGDAIEVFDVAGARIASRSGVESAEFAMDGAKGVYIVKVGNKSYKVRL